MKRKKTVQIGIKIDETTRRSLEEAAKGTRLGISTLVRLGIEKVLKEWNERKCVSVDCKWKDDKTAAEIRAEDARANFKKKSPRAHAKGLESTKNDKRKGQ